jgi:transcriptional regulator with XRE-family HTH domain
MSQKNSAGFLEWLDKILLQRGITDSQLAKQAGISHTVISKARSGLQPIGWEACTAIAKALEIPQSDVLIIAGHLERPPAYVEGKAEWDALYDKLSTEDLEEMMALGQLKIKRRHGKK